MLSVWKRGVAILALLASICLPAAAESATDTAGSVLGALAMKVGVQQFTDPVLSTGMTNPVSYQSLGLSPDLSFGPFGIGLNLAINYRFQDGSPVIRKWDWWPEDVSIQNVAATWLPKITYVRWGVKGEPLFVKAGQIDDATLGNGFIMSGYANNHYVPEEPHFGLSFDLDGALFKFPLVGFESFLGNMAQLDVMGGRLYVRPLMLLNIPILKDLQVGATIVADTKPLLQYPNPSSTASTGDPMAVYGGDLRLPIIGLPVFSLAAFGDVAAIAGKSLGGMVGAGGKLFGLASYGFQMRVMADNFIPSYFDATYDLYRAKRNATAIKTGTGVIAGYFGSLGFSLLDDNIVFNASISGAINPTVDPNNTNNYPHLRGVFVLKEGLLSGLSFDASYDKQFIDDWSDLISAENAAIQAKLNYKTGPAVISFVYKIVYDPTKTPNWETTSGLESSIQLF